jgi:hypothetical protein
VNDSKDPVLDEVLVNSKMLSQWVERRKASGVPLSAAEYETLGKVLVEVRRACTHIQKLKDLT